MSTKKIEEIIQYTQMPGVIQEKDKQWDDYDDAFQKEIFKNKIINIKIYFSPCISTNKKGEKNKNNLNDKYIIGISYTYKNLVTRKIQEIKHFGSGQYTEMKELVLEDDEYLSKFYANYDDKSENFLTIGFGTNKNKQILVGQKEDSDVYFNSQNDKNIIAGSFGHLTTKIDAIGCLYYKKSIILKYDIFKFLELKYRINKNKELKSKIEKEVEEFDSTYKFIWRTVNLPDTAFAVVIKFCCF